MSASVATQPNAAVILALHMSILETPAQAKIGRLIVKAFRSRL